jgi:Asp/Glu/hydantoin racemase
MPRVALIHAVSAAIPPVVEAFRTEWPDAELESLLDEGLTPALRREGGVTPRLVQRICDLATYAARGGADGILFTCSAFSPAMDAARRRVTVPVLKPGEAMVDAALDAGRRIGVVVTMPDAAPATEAELRAAAAARGQPVEVLAAVAPGAFAALEGGDLAAHDRLVAETAATLASRVDAVCLAQFSMARARPAVAARVTVPVLASPHAAVARLRALLGAAAPGRPRRLPAGGPRRP